MSDKDEIFEYVMNNPENTNPAILRGMLDNLSGGASDEPFILHGTLTSETGGTIEETPESLAAAITARKRIILSLDMGGGVTADVAIVAAQADDSGMSTGETVTCMASIPVLGTEAQILVYDENGAIIFTMRQYQLAST